jgi:hypothetical protein
VTWLPCATAAVALRRSSTTMSAAFGPGGPATPARRRRCAGSAAAPSPGSATGGAPVGHQVVRGTRRGPDRFSPSQWRPRPERKSTSSAAKSGLNDGRVRSVGTS